MTKQKENNALIWQYHERTKHTLQRYAAGPEALDWDDQPEAFRWFDGTKQFDLPLTADAYKTSYVDLYQQDKVTVQPFNQKTIACLLELSFGLSAWKQYGEAKWSLRCNPSSGNLHAEETYVVCNATETLDSGVYHYLSRDHQLEQRCQFDSDQLPNDTLLIGISSIQWREAWKYGERAYRYCQLDTGHAIAALRYAAALLGWNVEIVETISDEQLATLLGINRLQDFGNAEREHPDVLLQIDTSKNKTGIDINRLTKTATTAQWQGRANVLSERHMHNWPIIEDVSASAVKPVTNPQPRPKHQLPTPLDSECRLEATTLIRRRRSAQAFDGETHISSNAFFRMLDMTLPRQDLPPWDSTPWNDSINLVLFIHRVDDITPGLYTLVRNTNSFEDYKSALGRDEFQWQKVNGYPKHIALYRLVQANGQNLASTLSCHQGIAGQSCFSLGMIADLSCIENFNWHYRRLYWEAGMIGQVLYLEAEAAGIQGTGIGCYFDDPVHELLGITDTT